MTKKEALPLVQRACGIAHERGAGMSLLALWELVLEEGLPSRVERERMLAEKLAESGADGGNTTTSSSPELLLEPGDAPDATA